MKSRIVRWAAGLALGLAGLPASAFPPPPPPPYVMEFGHIAAAQLDEVSIKPYAAFLAPDLKVFDNGKLIAEGKEAWLEQIRHDIPNAWRRVLGWSPEQDNVLLLEQYDDEGKYYAGRRDVIVDPRRVLRAVRYAIGTDKLVHEIRILRGGYVWFDGSDPPSQ